MPTVSLAFVVGFAQVHTWSEFFPMCFMNNETALLLLSHSPFFLFVTLHLLLSMPTPLLQTGIFSERSVMRQTTIDPGSANWTIVRPPATATAPQAPIPAATLWAPRLSARLSTRYTERDHAGPSSSLPQSLICAP